MSHRRRPACEMNLAFRRMSRHNCDSGAPEGGHQSRSVLRGESSRSQQMKQSGWHRRVRARQWPPRPVAAGGFVRRWPPRSERSGWRGDHEPSTPGTCGARRGADGSYAARRCPPGHRLGIHPEHQGDLSWGEELLRLLHDHDLQFGSERVSSLPAPAGVSLRGVRPAMVPEVQPRPRHRNVAAPTRRDENLPWLQGPGRQTKAVQAAVTQVVDPHT